jgi:hypothetical protein
MQFTPTRQPIRAMDGASDLAADDSDEFETDESWDHGEVETT